MPKQKKKTSQKGDKAKDVATSRAKPYTRTKAKRKSQSTKGGNITNHSSKNSLPSAPTVSMSTVQSATSSQTDNQDKMMSLVPTIVTEVIRALGDAGLIKATQSQVISGSQQEQLQTPSGQCHSIPESQSTSSILQTENSTVTSHENLTPIVNDEVNAFVPQSNCMSNMDSISTSQTSTPNLSPFTLQSKSQTPGLIQKNSNISIQNVSADQAAVMQTKPGGSHNLQSGGLSLIGQTLQKLLNSGEAQGGSDCILTHDNVASLKDSQLPLQVPLGLGVSQTLRQKIVNEEYIDFYLLLQDNPTESLTLNFTQNVEGQTVAISPGKSREKKITNFNTWLKAFEIYVAIYSRSHPDKTPGLMKYASNMRELNDTYGSAAWGYYDKAFRKWRQYNKSFPWGVLYMEFYAKAMATGMTNGRNTQMQSLSNMDQSFLPFRIEQPFQPFRMPFNQKGPKLCNWFAYKGKCRFDPCKFRHVCPLCNGHHPVFKCFKNKSTAEHDSNKQYAYTSQSSKNNSPAKTNRPVSVKSKTDRPSNPN